jgi:hypothetical protein
MLFIPRFFLSFRATPCVSETACAATAIPMTVEWKAIRSVSKYVRGRLSLEKVVNATMVTPPSISQVRKRRFSIAHYRVYDSRVQVRKASTTREI